ncbi:hypothetical protein ETD86_35205 [Nonomuraea turkmeniaca]|uniref:SH3 domain-containing protein n=1 Tax=Nonomuraea turkmeniaca TaxID=103838 RepID=A0A5S4F653_9ACTN|nr:hypothetical protein [Nonomuraea turkmeniaca]TMR11604.1 hypothetical protein ETD86_35205 [Nonomuraea turkmeniaca]
MHLGGAALAGLLAIVSMDARPQHDFAAHGVVIWSEPRPGSALAGLGYPGEGFESDRSEEREHFSCGPFDSTLWHHGHNATTGIIGWVPACHLLDPD